MTRFSLPTIPPLFAILGTACVLGVSNLSAVTVIQDEFDNGNTTSGATTLPTASWTTVGNHAESGGSLTLTTAAIGSFTNVPNQWSGSVLYSNTASPNLNIFTQTIGVSIRGFTLSAEGDHVSTNPSLTSVNNRFRIGLMPKDGETYSAPQAGTPAAGGNAFSQFYNNGNDGISLNLSLNSAGFTTFDLRYKSNVTSATDPSIQPTGGGGSIGFLATGFDFSVNATNWSVTFLGAAAQSITYQGTWSLSSFASTWGDAQGNAAFIMGVQNMGAAGNTDPTASSNGSVTATIGSLLVTAVPEPSRVMLFMAAACGLLTVRRRSLR